MCMIRLLTVETVQLLLQVLADLACFYDACIRSAEPPPGVPGKVLCALADMPDTFAAAVQVCSSDRLSAEA